MSYNDDQTRIRDLNRQSSNDRIVRHLDGTTTQVDHTGLSAGRAVSEDGRAYDQKPDGTWEGNPVASRQNVPEFELYNPNSRGGGYSTPAAPAYSGRGGFPGEAIIGVALAAVGALAVLANYAASLWAKSPVALAAAGIAVLGVLVAMFRSESVREAATGVLLGGIALKIVTYFFAAPLVKALVAPYVALHWFADVIGTDTALVRIGVLMVVGVLGLGAFRDRHVLSGIAFLSLATLCGGWEFVDWYNTAFPDREISLTYISKGPVFWILFSPALLWIGLRSLVELLPNRA